MEPDNQKRLDKRQLVTVLGLVGFMMLGLGILLDRTRSNKVEVIRAVNAGTKEDVGQLVVDIGGAVLNPGVYKMRVGDRVQDLIDKSGGFTAKTDTKWVEVNLNRATKLTDGLKLYIPYVDSGQNSGRNVSKLVNINSAGSSTLEDLPGVGPAIAEKIISGRPYARIEDLIEKKIISSKLFDDIRGLISVW